MPCSLLDNAKVGLATNSDVPPPHTVARSVQTGLEAQLFGAEVFNVGVEGADGGLHCSHKVRSLAAQAGLLALTLDHLQVAQAHWEAGGRGGEREKGGGGCGMLTCETGR